MPSYMKIEGIVGPLTCHNSKGWIEIHSFDLLGEAAKGKGGKGEILVVKPQDSTMTHLFRRLQEGGQDKKVTIVSVYGGSCEYLRINLSNTVISSFSSLSGQTGSPPMEMWTLAFTDIKYESGSSALLCQMVRPQDKGALMARAQLNQCTKTE